MKWNKFLVIGLIIISGEYALSFATQVNGGSPASFLEFGAGSRALGMGGAYSAIAEGYDAFLWNPAGLGRPYQTGVCMSHVTLFEDAKLSAVSIAHAFRRPFGLGFSAIQFTMPGATRRDALNNPLGEITDSRTGFLFGFGVQPWEKVTIGTTQKMIRRNVDGLSATAWDTDIGFSIRFNRLRLGFESQNLFGSKLNRDGGYDSLPRTQRFGGAFTAGGFLMSADIIFNKSFSPEFRTGLEYTLFNIAALRAGWDGNYPTFGGMVSSYGLSFDYAILKHDVLGISHRISLRAGFGRSTEQKELARTEWRKEYLAKRIDKNPPQIIISTPSNNCETFGESIDIAGLIQDDNKIASVSLNGNPLERKHGISVLSKTENLPKFKVQDTFFFNEKSSLVIGQNYLIIEAHDASGKTSISQVIVFRKPTE